MKMFANMILEMLQINFYPYNPIQYQMNFSVLIFRQMVPGLKRLLGIKDISLIRKKLKKNIDKLIYHKKYDAQELVDKMKALGMNKGSIVCIHASMMQFFNYTGTAEELIDTILKEIGEEGTLVMPASPIDPKIPFENYVFNPKTTPTKAGYLAETFRKYPGVKRSNNVHHSVCAIGKWADYLIKDHTSGENCWDEKSPYYKMCDMNALVFNLGMPRWYIGTFHHCVEALLYKTYPFWNQFFTLKQKYNYIDFNGNVHTYYNLEGTIVTKTKERRVTKYFTPQEWKITKLSNLEIKVFYSKKAFEKMYNLGKQGISVYYIPSNRGYEF